MDAPEGADEPPMTFEQFRQSFYYGDRADMQFKYLARMTDEAAADTVAALLKKLGEALDTGELEDARRLAFEAQFRAYAPPEPPEPEVDDAPFTPLRDDLRNLRVALISAGGSSSSVMTRWGRRGRRRRNRCA